MALTAFPAHAELYRWIDRESGSVKFSNTPPPWFGDPEKERQSPAVEVIRYKPPAAPGKPAAATAEPSLTASLEARWATLMQFFSALPATTDFERAGGGLQQQIEAYQAVSAELDRIDPAGAARRRAAAQEQGILQRLRSGLEAQFSTKPPASK